MLCWGSMLPLVGSGISYWILLTLRCLLVGIGIWYWILLSLWSLLGFSGPAEKTGYEFKDICPHSKGWTTEHRSNFDDDNDRFILYSAQCLMLVSFCQRFIHKKE